MIFLSQGEKIKKLRKKLNIKQTELEEIGVSRSYVSMVESNKRNLSEDTLKKLIELLKKKASIQGIELENIDEDLFLSEIDQAKVYCESRLLADLKIEDLAEVINIGEEYNLSGVLLKAYTLKGNSLYDEKNYNLAFIFYSKTLDICIATQNNDYKPFIYNKLGKCKLQGLCYEEALSYFMKCNFFASEIADNVSIKNSLYNIALVYIKMGSLDNSLEYVNKFLEVCGPTVNFQEYISGIILKSNSYLDKKEYATAIQIYNEVLNKYEDKLGAYLGYIYNNLGLNYLRLNEIETSLNYFDKASKIRIISDTANLSHTLIDKSRVYIHQGLSLSAISLLQEGIALAKRHSDKEYVITGYLLLEELYISQNCTEKLEEIYLQLIEFLDKTDKDLLTDICIKLSIIYLDTKEYLKCKEILCRIQETKDQLNLA